MSNGNDVRRIRAKRQDAADNGGLTDGKYGELLLNQHGDLRVDMQHVRVIDDCDATTGWAAVGDATDNLTVDLNHVFGTKSLEFDKVDGTNIKFAVIGKTIDSFDIHPFLEEGGGFLLWNLYLSDISEVEYAFVRLGTDSSNYNEWRIADAALTTDWNLIRVALGVPSSEGATGNGWDTEAVTYVAVGVAFDGEANTLADILVDHIHINSGLQTSSDITTETTTTVNTANINLLRVSNSAAGVAGAGAVQGGTQRTTLASDDPLVVAAGGAETLYEYFSVAVNAAAGATAAIKATPGGGKQLWVYGYELHANVSGTYKLSDDAVDKTGVMPVGANGGVVRDVARGAGPIFKCATDDALNITTVDCEIDGVLHGFIVTV